MHQTRAMVAFAAVLAGLAVGGCGGSHDARADRVASCLWDALEQHYQPGHAHNCADADPKPPADPPKISCHQTSGERYACRSDQGATVSLPFRHAHYSVRFEADDVTYWLSG